MKFTMTRAICRHGLWAPGSSHWMAVVGLLNVLRKVSSPPWRPSNLSRWRWRFAIGEKLTFILIAVVTDTSLRHWYGCLCPATSSKYCCSADVGWLSVVRFLRKLFNKYIAWDFIQSWTAVSFTLACRTASLTLSAELDPYMTACLVPSGLIRSFAILTMLEVRQSMQQ